MAREIPTGEPDELIAGDVWTWKITDRDFPASTATISYRIVGTDALTWDAGWVTVDGDVFIITIPADQTARLGGGCYRVWRTCSDATDRATVEVARFNVAPNPLDLTDTTSDDEKELAAVNVALKAFATSGAVKYYMIGTQQVTREELPAVLAWRDRLEARIRAARARRGGGLGTTLRFGFPSVR